MAIVQRFWGGFPFFSVFYVCFYKKMGGSSGCSGGGAQGGIPTEPGGKMEGIVCVFR